MCVEQGREGVERSGCSREMVLRCGSKALGEIEGRCKGKGMCEMYWDLGMCEGYWNREPDAMQATTREELRRRA
jgi:hypothetical protein